MHTFATRQNRSHDPSVSPMRPVGTDQEHSTSAATRFAHDFSRIPVRANVPASERDADRVADEVMRIAGSYVERSTNRGDQLDAGPGDSLLGGGERLDPNVRAFFEPRFEHDFSQVRLHTDDRAAAAAQSVHARAFTFGNHVVMGEHEYQAGSIAGRKLLAHELTHVVQQRQEGTGAVQRQPATPAPALPASKKDKKTLSKGEMSWELKAVSQRKADVDIDFKPDKDKVDAKNVAFAQTVKARFGTTPGYAGGPLPYGDKATYSPFEETTGTRADHFAKGENDPFYGAMWDQSAKKWATEGATWGKPGSSTKGTSSDSTKLHDAPEYIEVRKGHGDFAISFVSVAVVQETQEPLGALTWGYKVADKSDSPIVLTGATKADCTDAPSASFGRAMNQFYAAKFDVVVDGFAAGTTALTAAHKTKLDTLVTRLKADPTLQVQLGGGADLKEANAQDVSAKRAEAAKVYLVSKGVTNTIAIESYGSDWARAATSAGKDEPKNRRVQVWVHK